MSGTTGTQDPTITSISLESPFAGLDPSIPLLLLQVISHQLHQ